MTDTLGANPIEYITHETGTCALAFLMVTLSVLRRMLGLFAFFYASLHLLTWIVLDQFFDAPAMIEDIAKRPYITPEPADHRGGGRERQRVDGSGSIAEL